MWVNLRSDLLSSRDRQFAAEDQISHVLIVAVGGCDLEVVGIGRGQIDRDRGRQIGAGVDQGALRFRVESQGG